MVGLTSLIPIYDPLEDGEEIEWIDRTGETVADMHERILDEDQLEAPVLAGLLMFWLAAKSDWNMT